MCAALYRTTQCVESLGICLGIGFCTGRVCYRCKYYARQHTHLCKMVQRLRMVLRNLFVCHHRGSEQQQSIFMVWFDRAAVARPICLNHQERGLWLSPHVWSQEYMFWLGRSCVLPQKGACPPRSCDHFVYLSSCLSLNVQGYTHTIKVFLITR